MQPATVSRSSRPNADLGKSGVVAKNRIGLGELLKDVVGRDVNYKAVLVYDVSRWGRFPNGDEAAHYEFLCSSSGIPLHYCAELFSNDGTAASCLLKALKRTMAAEFSRELGDKVFRGKTRIVEFGFWVGGTSGYGFRRLMVSANGKPKQIMKPGEQKSLTTDRVTLIHGPRKEFTEALNVPRPNCLLFFLSNSLVEGSASSLTQQSRHSRPYRRNRRGGRDGLACTSGRVQ